MKVYFGLFTNQLAEQFKGLYVYGGEEFSSYIYDPTDEELETVENLLRVLLGNYYEPKGRVGTEEPYKIKLRWLVEFIIYKDINQRKGLWLPEQSTILHFVSPIVDTLINDGKDYGVDVIYTNNPSWLDALGKRLPLDSFYGVTPNELRPINVYEAQPKLDEGWELGDLINVGDPSTPFGPW